MKILVVDDQELNLNLLRYMLEQEQHTVALAADGDQALSVFDEFLPDLVLLDVMMPNKNGYEVAPVLKAKSKDVYLPIIFITALDDKNSLEKCLQVGGDDFLIKPFDKVILSAKIKAHTRTRELSIKTYKQNQELEFYRNQTEREYELVEHIFDNALEKRFTLPEIVDYKLSPASMFNGDLFLMAPSPAGGIYMMMGDFTGHGLAAAIGVLPASKVFYSMAQKGLSVGDIASELNQTLYELLPSNMFCAASIVELNSSGRSFSAWLGGLPDAFLIGKEGKVKHLLSSRHMALGILDDKEFERDPLYIETAIEDKLILYTDGVVEAENTQGEFFGEDRLLRQMTASSFTDLNTIVDSVKSFTGNQNQQDDVSLALITCRPALLEPQYNDNYMASPLDMRMVLDTQQLKTTNPILNIVEILCAVEGFAQHRSNLFLLLSETFNNALEHGLLGLSSNLKDSDQGFYHYYDLREQRLAALDKGKIVLAINYIPDEPTLSFTVTDSGKGFDTHSTQHIVNSSCYGRGLNLIKEIAQSVKYNDRGNEVTISYSLLNR